jgi:alkyl hydroperoxide reductase subunit AhpC
LTALQLGDEAPNFQAETTAGPIDFHDFLGNGWGVLFSHPADFTPVCTAELGEVARLKDEFAKRHTKVLAISVDPLESHERWLDDITEVTGVRPDYPLIADQDPTVAALYGMLHPSAGTTHTVRSVFVIGPDKKVKLTLTYPASTGRDFTEILRVLDSLQLTANYQVATPAVSDADAALRFPGYTTIKPYLRKTAQPG